MKTIQVQPLTKEAFAPFGSYYNMENPEGYESLVVRVSGFSGFYTKLSRDVQKDILKRTEKTV